MTIAAPPQDQTPAASPEDDFTPPIEDRIPPPVRSAMRDRGFTELTAVQRSVLGTSAKGRDLLISSETGSGKTVALGLSMAEELIASTAVRDGLPRVFVITPTRELAAQVQRELGWLYAEVRGVATAVVTGGTNIIAERRQLARGPRVVVGTPGRLLDHIRNGALDCDEVAQVVLDEADQMLDMGFREELEGILEAVPAERRTHLVSATFPPAIRTLAKQFLRDPLHVEGTRLGQANEDIEHVAHMVHADDRYAALVNLLLLAGDRRTLVFVNTRAATAEISESLFRDGFSAMPLSGELAQSQRTRTLAAFRSGAVKVLVATDVAARGLDIPDVGTVVHAGPPDDAEAYVHRSGRTGRAGRKGRSLLLVTPRMRRGIQRLLDQAEIDAEWREVPGPDHVREQLAGEERQRLMATLDESERVGDEHRKQAHDLVAERDPVDVIAALLAAVEPRTTRELMEINPVRRRDPGSGKHDRRAERKFEQRGRRPFGKGAQRGATSYQRFQVNWGFKSGANPSRVMAMVCRRGRVTSKDIGSIDIDAHRSTFEISRDAALAFEREASRPDSRDPKTQIRRLGGRPRR